MDTSSTTPAGDELVQRGLVRQVVVQAMAVFLFWWAVDALVRTAIELYEEFDLELPVNTNQLRLAAGGCGGGGRRRS